MKVQEKVPVKEDCWFTSSLCWLEGSVTAGKLLSNGDGAALF